VELAILQDIIEAKKLGLHIIDLLGAPVAEILVADGPANGPGIQVTNTGVPGQPDEPAMSVLLKSLQEIGDEFPAVRTRIGASAYPAHSGKMPGSHQRSPRRCAVAGYKSFHPLFQIEKTWNSHFRSKGRHINLR